MNENEYYVAKLHKCNECLGDGVDFTSKRDYIGTCIKCGGTGKVPEWLLLKVALKEMEDEGRMLWIDTNEE